MSKTVMAFSLVAVLASFSVCRAGQPLETESARTIPRGAFKVECVYEHQFSSEGSEVATPTAIEYGVRDDLELLIEPVFYTSIRPKTGAKATGLGDLEATLTYRVIPESGNRPAFAVAGEAKIPTTDNVLIGTGKADYTGYLIASKRVHSVDVHGNLGYTIIGQPSGPHLNNIVDYALAAEFHLNPRSDLVAEFIGNTSSTSEGEGADAEGSVNPEAAGGEMVGLIGGRWHATPVTTLALGITYDNNSAVLLRPGVTFRW